MFADWTAGVVTPYTGGGSANPPASPQGVSDGGLALAGMTEQQIEMNSNPPLVRGRPATTIRRVTVTLHQISAVMTQEGVSGVYLLSLCTPPSHTSTSRAVSLLLVKEKKKKGDVLTEHE